MKVMRINRKMMAHSVLILFLISYFLLLSGCSGCRSGEDEPVRISSGALTLSGGTASSGAAKGSPKQSVTVINIGPSKDSSPQRNEGSSVPDDVNIDTTLTTRLKDKLAEAFASRGGVPPDIDIYTGVMSLESFSKFYEDKGLKIQRTSIPASQVVAPLLEEKPELASKINMGDYAGVTINQVIVEGANISAADKYIDPETYQIVYKTFVTVTKTK